MRMVCISEFYVTPVIDVGLGVSVTGDILGELDSGISTGRGVQLTNKSTVIIITNSNLLFMTR